VKTHGRESTYAAARKCTLCTAAHAQCHARWRIKARARVAAQSVDVAHGASGYGNWGCRCDRCSDANRAARKARGQQS